MAERARDASGRFVSATGKINPLAGAAQKAGVSIAALTRAISKLNKAQKNLRANDAAKRILGIVPKAKAAGGALGQMAGKGASPLQTVLEKLASGGGGGMIGKVAGYLQKLGPAGLAAAAALVVVVGLVTATAVAFHKLFAAALAVTEQRSALLATWDALGRGAGQGKATLAIVDKLAAKLPFTVEQMSKWATSFMQARVQGQHLERALKATAAATAMLGEGGGAAAQEMISRLYKTRLSAMQTLGAFRMQTPEIIEQFASMGLRIEDVTKELGILPKQLRGTKISADQMAVAIEHALMRKGAGSLVALSTQWDTMTKKMSEGVMSLFEGASEPIKKFQEEIYSLFTEFWKGSATMEAGKGVMTSVLSALFKVATIATNAIHKGFLQVQIAVLKVAIALAPIVSWFIKIYSNAMVLDGLWILFKALVAPVVIVTAAIVAMGAALGALIAIASAAVAAVVAGVGWLVGEGADLASAFVDGLVNGIKSGVTKVINATADMARAGLNAFKSVLGIHSPSAVMRIQGMYTAQGAAQGIERGTPMVTAAAGRMGGDVAETGGASMRSGGGGRSLSVKFEDGAIRIEGAGKSAMEITEEMLTLVLERIAASQGLVGAS